MSPTPVSADHQEAPRLGSQLQDDSKDQTRWERWRLHCEDGVIVAHSFENYADPALRPSYTSLIWRIANVFVAALTFIIAVSCASSGYDPRAAQTSSLTMSQSI